MAMANNTACCCTILASRPLSSIHVYGCTNNKSILWSIVWVQKWLVTVYRTIDLKNKNDNKNRCEEKVVECDLCTLWSRLLSKSTKCNQKSSKNFFCHWGISCFRCTWDPHVITCQPNREIQPTMPVATSTWDTHVRPSHTQSNTHLLSHAQTNTHLLVKPAKKTVIQHTVHTCTVCYYTWSLCVSICHYIR